MCLLVIALNSSERFPLIAVHIRDEDPDRVSTPLRMHDDGLVYSKDVRGGGSAVAWNPERGAIAFLNNLHEPVYERENVASRGRITLAAALSGQKGVDFLSETALFNPFQCFIIESTDLCNQFQVTILRQSMGVIEVEHLSGHQIVAFGNTRQQTERCNVAKDLIDKVIHSTLTDIDDVCKSILNCLSPVLLKPYINPTSIPMCSREQTIFIYDNQTACMRERQITWHNDIPTFSDLSPPLVCNS